MPRKRSKPKSKNYLTNESKNDEHAKAIKLSKERKKYEKGLIKQGKKQVLINHPTSPKCKIIKFI